MLPQHPILYQEIIFNYSSQIQYEILSHFDPIFQCDMIQAMTESYTQTNKRLCHKDRFTPLEEHFSKPVTGGDVSRIPRRRCSLPGPNCRPRALKKVAVTSITPKIKQQESCLRILLIGHTLLF